MKDFGTIHYQDSEYIKTHKNIKYILYFIYIETKNNESIKTVSLVRFTSEYLASSLGEIRQTRLQTIINQINTEGNAQKQPLEIIVASIMKKKEYM